MEKMLEASPTKYGDERRSLLIGRYSDWAIHGRRLLMPL